MLLASFITLFLIKSGILFFLKKFDLSPEKKDILKFLLTYVKMLISLLVLGFSLLESISTLSIER